MTLKVEANFRVPAINISKVFIDGGAVFWKVRQAQRRSVKVFIKPFFSNIYEKGKFCNINLVTDFTTMTAS